jgi:hypothetical protein
MDDERWVYVEGRRDGRAYAATARVPLDRTAWPEFDHHVAVEVSYAPQWRNGWPKPKELTRLQELEDRLAGRMEGHGVLVGSETCNARRLMHFFVRGGGPIVEMFRRREEQGRAGGMKVAVAHDPTWSRVAHLAAAAARAA